MTDIAAENDVRERLLQASETDDGDAIELDSAAQKHTKEPPRSRMRPVWRTRAFLLIAAVIMGLAAVLVTGGIVVVRRAPPDGESPPWYPSPAGGTLSAWEDSYRKAAILVKQMSLPGKVNITTGTGWSMGLAVGNTGPADDLFPGLALQDGPLGIRFADNATAFPAGITVGATWNRKLMYQRGKAHGKEARLKGINVLLGPCVGPLGRMPAGGRNWEGFGPDPYLQGVAASETVKGIQSENVIATIKHFIGNEQEHFRQSWEWLLPNAMSSNIGDRTLHELYLWPFADAVKAGVGSVMCSYQMTNNSYSCGNSKLLNGILKDELGFQGFVQSDWLAARSGVASALAGLDMTMPGDGLRWAQGVPLWGPELTKAVLNGSLPIDRLDDMVTRIVATWYQLGQDDLSLFDQQGPNFSSWTNDEEGVINPGSPDDHDLEVVNKFVDVQGQGSEAHAIIARRVAIEGSVLVKNINHVLPLSKTGLTSKSGGKYNVGIFGEDAGPGEYDDPNHCPDRSCNVGTLASGWGSGAVEFPYLITPFSAIKDTFENDTVAVQGYLTNEIPSKAELEEQDLCLVFVNSDSGEGYQSYQGIRGDRNNLHLQKGGGQLVLSVAKHCGGPTVVIVHNVGSVVVEEWIDHPQVEGVIVAHLPSQESGNAIAAILFGDANPSGKLPYTIAKSLDDFGEAGKVMYYPPVNPLTTPQQNFSEGLYVDYRHFDKYNIEPRFPFGYGLSYTTFEYADISVESIKRKSALPDPRQPPSANPPSYSEVVPDPQSALFPENFRKLSKYIYPYIDQIQDIKGDPYTYPEGYDTKQSPSPAGGGEGGNPSLFEVHYKVQFKLRNTGKVAGAEVVQLYLSYPGSSTAKRPTKTHDSEFKYDNDMTDFPVQVLRGFEKVFLQPGEESEITLELTRRDLSFWHTGQQNWVMPTDGKFVVRVGSSSRDLKLEASF